MVKIYTSDTCGYCTQAKKLFNKLNIEYTEHNITRDPEALQQYSELVGNNMKTVPLTTNGKSVVFGYNIPKLISLAKSS